MSLQHILAKTNGFVRSNSPEILSASAILGVLSTSYLVGKATFEAASLIEKEQEDLNLEEDRPQLDTKDKIKLVWRLYIPAGISGAATIGCIFTNNKVSGRRTAAAVAAYSLTERAFSEYREKVVEELGKGKEQKIRDQIVQDKINTSPVGTKEVLVLGTGHILCCELHTHRYFRSDMETLRKAQNDINARIVSDVYVRLSELYDILGIENTSNSDDIGWTSDRLVEFEFSTVLSEDGEPCLAFDYNYVKPLFT